MPSPDTLDLAALLNPLSAEDPCGKDLRLESPATSPYFRLKDARTNARAAERAAESDDEKRGQYFVASEWRVILQDAPRVLAEQSKDFEIAAWLTEALIRHKRFAGLRDGFRLLNGLTTSFWDGIFPRPDEDGISTRVAALTGLNGNPGSEGSLIAPIRRVPITAASNGREFSHWHWVRAVEIDRIQEPEKRQQQIDRGAVALEHFRSAVAETRESFHKDLVDDLGQCLEEYQKLCAALDSRCGADSPPATNIKTALEAVLETLHASTGGRFSAAPSEEATPEGGNGSVAGGDGHAPISGAMRSREEAFATLVRVAHFFRTTEPHSPLSYVLEQAVRWGRMPLPELLDELITDNTARTSLKRLTGIPIPPSE